MASSLLDSKHDMTEVEDVLLKLRVNDKAFYNPETKTRKVPVFGYDHEGAPFRISHWQTRRVTDSWVEARDSKGGLDFYHETRGWIRGSKKAERDFDYKPDIEE